MHASNLGWEPFKRMAVSSRDVNVKEGKKGKEKTEMERKL